MIRAAAAADIPALAAIAAAAYARDFAGLLEPAALAQRGAAFFAGHLMAALIRLRVAELDGAPVGFTLATRSHLDMLFVAEGRRDRGVGAALLGDAQAAGVASLECFRDNTGARRFYERHGWRVAAAYEREFLGRPRAFVRYEL